MRKLERMTALLLALYALAAMTFAGRAETAGAWVVDPNSGCRVWNPHPSPNEMVVWQGACAHGYAQGQGTVRWFEKNAPYEEDKGAWHEGKQTGVGRQEWPSGRYEGTLANSEPNGHGVLTLRGQRYEGEFRNGKPNGPGTLKTLKEVFKGDWKNGCLGGGERKVAVAVPLSSCQ